MRFDTRRRRSMMVLPVALVLSAGVVACGSDDDDDGGKRETVSFTVTGNEKEITAKAPGTVKGGVVDLELKNDGKLPVDGQLIRVDGDQTAEDVEKIIEGAGEGKPIPPWLHAAGGPPTAVPGATSSATQELAPGNYYFFGEPDTEGEDEGPAPAAVKFEVEANGDGELPKTDATITARDYSFEATGLKAGKNEVEIDNAGKELHHVIAFPLLPGKTLDDAKKVLASEEEPSGPPPFDEKAITGTTVLEGGEKQVLDLDLKKGKNVLVCFISDRKGGPPHVAKGMISETNVE